jgi:hypothetical protein
LKDILETSLRENIIDFFCGYKLAGLSKTTFAEILADYGVSLINYSIDDVINDAANI